MTAPLTRRSALGLGLGGFGALLLAGCGEDEKKNAATTGSATSEPASTSAAAASDGGGEAKPAGDPKLQKSVCGTSEDDGSNHEIPIGEAEEGPFKMEANYFQPGLMMPGTGGMMPAYKDSIAHIELDVKVNKEGTKYGWSVDETPADLQISYEVLDSSGKKIVEGPFMEMNAGDGSHYGTNIPKTAEANGLVGSLEKPSTFQLIFHVAPPKNYALHFDKRTGVEAKEWFKPFDVKMEWIYTAEQKKCIVDDPTK